MTNRQAARRSHRRRHHNQRVATPAGAVAGSSADARIIYLTLACAAAAGLITALSYLLYGI